jgi:hypothetical protein
MQVPLGFLAAAEPQDDLIDSIVDRPKLRPAPKDPDDSGVITDRITDRIKEQYMWSTSTVVATSAGSSIAILLALQYGLPVVLQAIRNARKQRGNAVLDDEQFKKLMDQYQNLLKLLEQNNTPPTTKP